MRTSCLFSLFFFISLMPTVSARQQVLAVDFNTNTAPLPPRHKGFIPVEGKQKTNNGQRIEFQDGGVKATLETSSPNGFDYRGSNARVDRVVPEGTTKGKLVADFICVNRGTITLTVTGLKPGRYVLLSYHLDTYFTHENYGEASGAVPEEAQQIVLMKDQKVLDSVWASALSPVGLGRTRISDWEIPTLGATFWVEDSGVLQLSWKGLKKAPDGERNLLMNGLELIRLSEHP